MPQLKISKVHVHIKIENCHYDAFKILRCVICRFRVFISLLLTSFVVAFAYYKLAVNIDGVIAIEISEHFNFNHRMELKKLCPDKSEEIIVVTLQVLWANSAYKDTTERKKIIREEAYLYRFDVPIEWQKDGVTERFFLTLLVTWEDLCNLGVKDAPSP